MGGEIARYSIIESCMGVSPTAVKANDLYLPITGPMS